MARKLYERVNSVLLPDSDGRIFISPATGKGGGFVDLTLVRLLSSTVDTVRQLYTGQIIASVYDRVIQAVESETYLIDNILLGDVFSVSRISAVSGYRYKLQNNELGIVVLLGSFYVLPEEVGSHLKFELSPHFIASRTPYQIQRYLDGLASIFLKDHQHSGCAVHLALDVQNWAIPNDFEDRFSTYARSKRGYDGMIESEFIDLATAATRFGKNEIETITYGKPNGLQTSLYRKDKEIIRSDKVDYFHGLWKGQTPGFEADKPVVRVEVRIHHSIVREIGQGIGQPMESFLQVSEYLTDIWRYALMKNRLDYSKTYIDAAWQLFIEDAEFIMPAVGTQLCRKKKQDVTAVSHNLNQVTGNLISLGARQGFTTKQLMAQFRKLFIYPDILRYYHIRGLTEDDLRQTIDKGLCLRRLKGKGQLLAA